MPPRPGMQLPFGASPGSLGPQSAIGDSATPGLFTDIIGQIEEERPEAIFNSFLDQFGTAERSPMRRFFQNRFQDIFGGYTGDIIKQLGRGEVPEQSFSDFLKQEPFKERFGSTAPALRGQFSSRYAPRTRSLFF